jgi:hypothetical protein
VHNVVRIDFNGGVCCMHQIPSKTALGAVVMRTPSTNKGLAFTHEEREKYGLTGLLPAGFLDLVCILI